MSSIFGGSSQSSGNQSYGTLSNALSGVLSSAGTGASALSKLLGGDSSGFDAYKKAVGYDATAKAGSQGITGNQAASGLLRSGSTGKSLQNYSANLANQYAGQYASGLNSLASLGLNAGSVLSGAGSTSSGSSKKGIGGLLGALAAA